MAMQALPAAGVRDNRLTTLVSDTEIKLISEMAAVSGMSVSAYLRERALGPSADPLEAAALEKIFAHRVTLRASTRATQRPSRPAPRPRARSARAPRRRASVGWLVASARSSSTSDRL